MRWQILGELKQKEPKKRREEIFEVLFKNRGLRTEKRQKEFLKPPRPGSFTARQLGISSGQTKKAITRIKKAVKTSEKIVVYGDYDADGICGTAILWETLNSIGANVLPYIPDRKSEGYGLNSQVIKRLKSQDPNLGLIITVDQGITAHQQVDFANSQNIDVIITDHHQLKKTQPKALAVVHTTKLAGTGVAWFLARQIFASGSSENLELAAIGTITDMLPLIGPNRCLVKWGLKQLNQTQRVGLKSLFKEAGIEGQEIGTYEIGFIIGPRFNAAGRIEDALNSLRLLCTRDRQRANKLALKLGKINRQRQEIMEETFTQAKETWQEQRIDGAKLIFVDDQDWDQGVIGLAASKLVREFYLPVIVVSRGKLESKASARSVNGFNIIKAIREAENLLVDAGGHPMAAGFTVETKNLKEVKEKLVSLAEQKIDSRILEKTLKVDCRIDLKDINWLLYEKIEKLAPFGVGNPQPDFVSRQVQLLDARLVGKKNDHLKLRVSSKNTNKAFPAIGFGLGNFYSKLSPEKPVDLAYSLLVNEWNGKKELQLKIKDIKINS